MSILSGFKKVIRYVKTSTGYAKLSQWTSSQTVEMNDGTTLENKISSINTTVGNKVDKVSGKGLSTNDYTTAEKNKLSNIEANANNYVHPTTSGNKHIPSGGASGQILRWSSDGTAAWGSDNNTTYSTGNASTSGLTKLYTGTGQNTDGTMTQKAISDSLNGKANSSHSHSNASTSSAGFMSAADKTKLDGIAEGATSGNYTHPTYTPKSSGLYKVTVDSTGHVSNTSAVTKSDITALGIPGTDTNTVYTHPTTDGNKHVPANGTTNEGKYLKATSTTGSYEWGDLTKSDIIDALGYIPGTSNADPITIDSTLSSTSTNAIQNKAVYSALSGKSNTSHTHSTGNASTAGFTKLYTATGTATDGTMTQSAITSGVNGVNFSGTCSTTASTAAKTVSITGVTSLVTGIIITVKFSYADTSTATTTLNVNSLGAKSIYYKGSAIPSGYIKANGVYTLRYNGTQWDLVGDINTNTTYSTATTSSSGLMSSAMVTKLNGIDANANNYTLPTASSTEKGGIKLGNGLVNDCGGAVDVNIGNGLYFSCDGTISVDSSLFTGSGKGEIYYGICSTDGGTAAKTVNITGFTSANLVEGTCVAIKFINGSYASETTLNVSNTGAKEITTSNYPVNGLLSSCIYMFMYTNGTWAMILSNPPVEGQPLDFKFIGYDGNDGLLMWGYPTRMYASSGTNDKYIELSGTILAPNTDNNIDLGKSTLRYKNAYVYNIYGTNYYENGVALSETYQKRKYLFMGNLAYNVNKSFTIPNEANLYDFLAYGCNGSNGVKIHTLRIGGTMSTGLTVTPFSITINVLYKNFGDDDMVTTYKLDMSPYTASIVAKMTGTNSININLDTSTKGYINIIELLY